jgi:hypothetical protein
MLACPDVLDVRDQNIGTPGPGTAQGGIAPLSRVRPIARRREPQHLQIGSPPKLSCYLSMKAHITHSNRRSRSACAKNALASFRISLALRSSLTSRSSALMRCYSLVPGPSCCPVSRSCWRTQLNSVRDVQPLLAAIDSTAAHWDG